MGEENKVSEEKKSPEELAADIALKKAQIEQSKAETKKIQAEAKKAESMALISEIEAHKKYRERQERATKII